MKRLRYLVLAAIMMLSVLPVRAVDYGNFTPGYGEGEGLTLHKVVLLVTDIINDLLALAVTLAIAMIVYGGFKMAMARGDQAAFKAAKGILYNAIIGLVIILSVGLIVATISNFAVDPTSILR